MNETKKTYTTASGSVITIGDDGIASVATRYGTGTIGAGGVRYGYTLGSGANLAPGKRGLVVDVCVPGSKGRVCLGLTPDVEAWLAANWPVRKTELEKWNELMPEDARAQRARGLKLAAHEAEFSRRMESEAESSVLPARPNAPAVELSAEGKAWLAIDAGCDKHNHEIAGIYQRARKSAVGGTPLVEALAQAERETEEFRSRHA